MTSLYHHLLWFTFLFMTFIVSFLMAIYVSYLNESFYVAFNLFSFWNNDMIVSFYFDYMSMWFSTVILLISSVIMVYSYFYMAPYSKTVYFLWITNLFILSMLLVVNLSNLFFLMLGWDGLGLVSFFLIVYYQNQSSITSGVFTLLMNRLGDSFFLVTIMLFFYYHSDLTSFSSNIPSLLVLTFLMLTFMTKSALYPFSPWLPLAMAAPTPISALVHSSTLVTSGLYLMMRFSYLLYSSYTLMKVLLILSLFTSFYAGMNSIFEKDLKKMIALSTLSHLGFIGMAFSAGLLQLAFFHMLTHALFKSLLFMTMGDIMINLNHSQDIRYLSSGMLYTPMSCLVMYVSILNLLGLPNLSGYFSKDLVLEMMNYSSSSILVMVVLFLNVFFTYYYTYQLFFYSFQPIKVLPYQNFHAPMLFHTVCLFFMAVSTLVFGFFFMSHICSFILFYPVPTVNKWLPLFLNMMMFLVLFLNKKLFTSNHPLINYYFSNMMYLSNIMLTASSNLYYSLGFMLVKSVELGIFNYTLNSFTKSSFFQLSHLFLKLSMLNSMKLVLYGSILLLVMNLIF
uniref:NADH:ubiquinone reductase (H(+)-translocating) n=1 Tax=Brachionus rubens TaxID=392764 RepID=A0A0C4KSE4_9BILA|nr:NADH dehydrogenase subunit 5 [Brachionus rubens]